MAKRYLLTALAALLVAGALGAQQVKVREEVLPNGMKLLMVERHDSPTVSCGWVAKVGSVNEPPGITGISHLFEHMMFKGTKTIGTSDYAKDAEIMAEQDAVRAEMEKEYTLLREKLRRGEISGNIYDPANMTPRLKELRAQLEKLFADEKKVIVKDELDQIYTKEGGSGLNAFTSEDQTAYFITVPSNKLELWFWLESDRLANPVFREFYSERDVVREERRLRTESTPDRQVRRGGQRDVLGVVAVLPPGRGLAVGRRVDQPGAGARVLRDLLRAQQPHRGPRRGLRPGQGDRAREGVLRAHPPRQDAAARDDHRRDAADRPEAPRGRGRHQPRGRHPLPRGAVRPQGHVRLPARRRLAQPPHRPAVQGAGGGREGRGGRAVRDVPADEVRGVFRGRRRGQGRQAAAGRRGRALRPARQARGEPGRTTTSCRR